MTCEEAIMGRILKGAALCAFTLAATLVFCMPVSVKTEAKIKTVSTKVSKYKKAAYVKKGTTKVIFNFKGKSNYYPYIRFKAPEKKTYTLTFYNLNAVRKADRSRNSVNGYINLELLNNGVPTIKKVKTNYGKAKSLKLASKNFYSRNRRSSGKKKVYRYLKKRFAKIKLDKGEVVYISGYFAGVSKSKASFYLKIK